MTRAGHYAEAEKLLTRAAEMPGSPEARNLIARAHVHALLATVEPRAADAAHELAGIRDAVVNGERL